MNININKKDLEEVLEVLYIVWDMAKEDLNDEEAENLSRIRDEVILPQYEEQCKREVL